MARIATAVKERYLQLGFRVIEGGKSGNVAVLKTPAVAEIFGKQHAHILRDVRDHQEEFRAPNLERQFAEHCRPATYERRGKNEPCFELTKVGFNTIALKYDGQLRFLLALAFDALEHDDATAGDKVIRQINARIRELRSGASGQEEIAFETAPSITPTEADPNQQEPQIEAPPANALAEPIHTEEAIWVTTRATEEPSVRWTHHHNGNPWYVLRRNDAAGIATMVCVTPDKARPTKYFALVPNPNGTLFKLCLCRPYPPIEVIERIYATLGSGPSTPIALATLRQHLS
jgi:phage regulator Rha-like protein